jgi:hypothetical protein
MFWSTFGRLTMSAPSWSFPCTAVVYTNSDCVDMAGNDRNLDTKSHTCRGSIRVCERSTPQPRSLHKPKRALCPRETRRKYTKKFLAVPTIDLMIASEVWI